MQIKNWQNLQHYKDRRPEWIKLYSSLLQTYEYVGLTDTSKLLLFTLYLLASRTIEGTIPYDLSYIRQQGAISAPITSEHIQELVDKGFLALTDKEQCPLASCYQDASNLLAECYSEQEAAKNVGQNVNISGGENADISPGLNRHDAEKTVINQDLVQSASNLLAECYQSASLERETEIEKERKKDKTAKTEKSVSSDFVFPEDFLDFWKKYPEKMRKEKKEALKAWKTAAKKVGAEKILACLDAANRRWAAVPRGAQDWQPPPPYPAKWLKHEPWLDSEGLPGLFDAAPVAVVEVPGDPLFTAVRGRLMELYGEGVFRSFFEKMTCSKSGNIVVFQVNMEIKQRMITQNYGSMLRSILAGIDPELMYGGVKHAQ
jgi:hypothetical protein